MTEFRLSRLGGLGARRALAEAAVFGVLWTVIEVELGGMARQAYNPIEVVWWRYAVHLLLMGAFWLGPFVALGLFVPFVWVAPGPYDALVLTAIGVLGFVALYAFDIACHVEPASVSAPGLFAHVPTVLALTFLGQGVHLKTRAATGSIALVIILALAGLLASAALPSRIEGKNPA